MPTLEIAIDARKAKDGSLVFDAAVKRITDGANRTDKALGGADKGMRKMGSTAKWLGGTAVLYALKRGLDSVVKSTIAQEEAIAQLNIGLKSTGGVSGQTVSGMVKLGNEIQKVTKYSNDEVMASEAMLLSFTNITDDVFPRTIKSIADISTRMGTDLKSSTLQVAKALNDPIANLGAMSRAGIQFTKDQKAMISTMWEAGRTADAQRLILKELERQYKGSAEAAGQTLGGAIARTTNAWDDFKKTLGDRGIGNTVTWLSNKIVIALNYWSEFVTDLPMSMQTASTAIKKIWENLKFGWNSMITVFKFAWDSLMYGLVTVASASLLKVVDLLGNMKEPLSKIGIDLGDLSSSILGFSAGLKAENQKPLPITEQLKALSQETEKAIIGIEDFDRLAKKNFRSTQKQLLDLMPEIGNSLENEMKKIQDRAKQIEDLAGNIGQAFGTAFETAIFEGEKLRDVMQNLLKDITRALFQATVTNRIVAGITGGLTGAISPTAHGGVITPMASGGVVNQPTFMPMANGGTAKVGEAGAEAVLPLERGADGIMGVRGGGTTVVMNIQTQDADSFRRSEKQIMQRLRTSIAGSR